MANIVRILLSLLYVLHVTRFFRRFNTSRDKSPSLDESLLTLRSYTVPGHPGLVIPPPATGVNPTIYLEPGFGGGCVQTGPFKNMTVNLGPIGLVNASAGPDGGLGYNPRCLKRDVGPYCSLKYCNYTRIYGMLFFFSFFF